MCRAPYGCHVHGRVTARYPAVSRGLRRLPARHASFCSIRSHPRRMREARTNPAETDPGQSGRHHVRAMTWGVLSYSFFSGMCGLAQTVDQLVALRFLSALGMGGEWSLGVALVMEVWPSDKRWLLAGIIGAAANVGIALIAFAGLYINQLGAGLAWLGVSGALVTKPTDNGGWRLLMMLGALPALLPSPSPRCCPALGCSGSRRRTVRSSWC